jgi:hypothetical protein
MSVFLRFRRKVQNLIDPVLECDQIPRNEFIAAAGEFVSMANLKNFSQAFVGIEAHAFAIGNGDENEILEFF